MNAFEFHELTPGPLLYLARMTKVELVRYAEERMLPKALVLRWARETRKELAKPK